jgi:3-oxoacyl-[acyl-carrier protein] reductase
VAQFDPANLRKLVEVNFVGAFNVLREAGQRVADGGSIIAISTSMVRHAVPGFGPYAGTKAAVECMVRSMAKEIAPRRVRVNAVAPGPVDTELFRAGKTEEAKQKSAALSPFNRIGTPAEVASVVAFLASDQASWIHGQVVQPNGGMV